jgi:hypothetical protein
MDSESATIERRRSLTAAFSASIRPKRSFHRDSSPADSSSAARPERFIAIFTPPFGPLALVPPAGWLRADAGPGLIGGFSVVFFGFSALNTVAASAE